jgi:dTDP-glucose 4,6-dehydratase
MMNQRKISSLLVTGGSGFMGSAFIRYLLQNLNFEGKVVNLDSLTYAANQMNLACIEKDSRYRFFLGDIRDQKLLSSICEKERIDTLVHFAAETHVDRSIEDPMIFIETNVKGTAALLEVVRKFPTIHFHHVSTDEVYGSLGKTGFFLETTPYTPNSPYSASKAASDHLVRSYGHTYGLSWTLSHSVNNYGPMQYPEKLIPLMIANCLQEKPLPIYGRGENVRDWIYVTDHADAVWRILCKGRLGEVYNIGGEREIKNIDLVQKLIELVALMQGKKRDHYFPLLSFVKDRLGHDFRYAIDGTKMKEELSWRAVHSLEEGLQKTVSWYLAQLEKRKSFDAVAMVSMS